jgi:hypothetical protein
MASKVAPHLESLWYAAQDNDDFATYVDFYAGIDDEIFAKHGLNQFQTQNQKRAWDAVAAQRKQQQATARERARIQQERAAIIQKQKDALQFSDALAQEICERISAGQLLTVMCENEEHLPTVRRVKIWLKQHQDFKMLFDEAQQDRLFIFEEQLVQIADDVVRDFDIVTKGKETRRVLDPARITGAKLRVEVRRLHLKAGNPAKWGETSTLITKSADDDFSNLSAEELERRIADIERKDGFGRKVA